MFTLSHTTRSYPRLPYEKIKDEVLGKNYQLSLVFVGEERGKELNQLTRNKTYAPNVLSFPLSKNSGEIFISPTVAKREAKKFHHSHKEHVAFLFIHGLLHLKGFDHGKKMEALEQKFLQRFSK